jgi:hypothetical protein
MENKISNTIQTYIEEFEQKTRARVIYVTVSGSKLYGTDNENSDTDLKGIFIPSVHSVMVKEDLSSYTRDTNNTKERNSADDIDFTLHSIYSFLGQLSKSETGAVDLLFSMFSEHNIKYSTEESDIIKENYKYFLNSNMKSFIGYALGQTKKFGIKGARYDELDSFVKEYFSTIPTEVPSKNDKIGELLFDDIKNFIKKKNYEYIKFVKAPGPRGSGTYEDVEYISILGKMFEGNVSSSYFMERVMKLYNQFGNRTKTIANTASKTDYKALSHSLRIAEEVKELLETEFIHFPLKNADYIREIKEGKHGTEEVIDKVQDVLSEVDMLLLTSQLPKEVDKELINLLILRLMDMRT